MSLRSGYKFPAPKINISFNKFYSYAAPNLYNGIPDYCKQNNSFNFKRNLKHGYSV